MGIIPGVSIVPGVPLDPGGAIQVRGAVQGADQVTINAEEDVQGTNEAGGDNRDTGGTEGVDQDTTDAGGAVQGATGYPASGGCVVRSPHQKCLTNLTWGGFQQVPPYLPPMAPVHGIPWTPTHEEATLSALEGLVEPKSTCHCLLRLALRGL